MRRIVAVEEVRRIQLDILEHVDNFCRANSIKYFLAGGSTIGAVRHKGYIPWDDDIDIMMLREDYDHFIRLYKELDNSEFRVHSCDDEPNFYAPFVKIDNSRTILQEGVNKQSSIGINIDLFPIDDLPDNTEQQKTLYKKVRFLINLYFIKQIKIDHKRSFIKNLILLTGRILLFPISLNKLANSISAFPQKRSYQNSEYCGIVVWGYGMREANLKSNYSDVLYTDFEGHKYPIPIGYDNYLRSVYGDYMQLPPEDQRVTHHLFSAYWK